MPTQGWGKASRRSTSRAARSHRLGLDHAHVQHPCPWQPHRHPRRWGWPRHRPQQRQGNGQGHGRHRIGRQARARLSVVAAVRRHADGTASVHMSCQSEPTCALTRTHTHTHAHTGNTHTHTHTHTHTLTSSMLIHVHTRVPRPVLNSRSQSESVYSVECTMAASMSAAAARFPGMMLVNHPQKHPAH